MVELLKNRIDGRAADDFVFLSRTGRPLHNGDFYTHVWRKLMAALADENIPAFRFHDLRHTHVAWLIAGGAPLPHIQARLGHESITTTIDTYGKARELHETGENPQVGCSAGSRSGRRSRRLERV